jgi:hypothetical protein
MIHGLFSVRDAATETYNITFTAPTNAAAIRQFGDLAQDTNTNVYKHPDDFVLYRVGSWDDDTGTVHPEELIKLAHARDYHGIQEST